MKKLGIVLLTYNRCRYVTEAINNLLPQLLKNKESVYLLICDNCSTDGTKDVLQPIADEYPSIIEYVRHSQNIGPRPNFSYGIEHIEAEYVLLHGDDDAVSPYFIDIILDLINRYQNIGLIHYNHIQISPNHDVVRLFQTNVQTCSMINYFNSGKDFIKSHMVSPSFMSSVVFRKDCILDGYKNCYHEDCYGYIWFLALYYGIRNQSCIYYSMPLVIQNSGEVYKAYALNTILGQQKIFDYLSPFIEGIDSYWKSCVAEEKYTDVLAVIRSIINYRCFYKDFYLELHNCLLLKKHRVYLWCAISLPSIVSRLLFVIFRIIQRIKKLI